MRTVIAALVLAGLVAVPAHAAEGETCQGKPATIVGGVSGAKGTEGDDVIVVRTDTTSLFEVEALGGQDTICIEGPAPVDHGPEDIVSFVDGGEGVDRLEVTASAEDDDLEVYDVEQVDIALLGGDDRLVLPDSLILPSNVAGGTGQNRLTLSFPGRLVADLNDELLVLDGVRSTLRAFQKVRASAYRAVLEGSAASEILQGAGCRVEVRGGKGDDFLTARAYKYGKGCHVRGADLSGQQGNDRLRGTTKNDRLVGGPGRDRANGKGGIDSCDAEMRKACER